MFCTLGYSNVVVVCVSKLLPKSSLSFASSLVQFRLPFFFFFQVLILCVEKTHTVYVCLGRVD